MSTAVKESQAIWGVSGALPLNVTRFLGTGLVAIQTNEIQLRLPRARRVLGITVRARVAPGVGNTATFTLRINGVDTAIVATLSDANTVASSSATPVALTSTDELSLKVVTSAAGATEDVVVTADLLFPPGN